MKNPAIRNKPLHLGLTFLLAAGISGLFFGGCQKEALDPCMGKHPVTADFSIEEMAAYPGWDWEPYETDTVLGYNVRFSAKEEGAEYKWYIGAGVYGRRVVDLNFKSVPKESSIPITLVVKKQPDKSCFHGDDGKDSVVKHMFISPITVVRGDFLGHYSDSPGDEFVVSLKDTFDVNAGYNRPKLSNLLRGCSSYLRYGLTGYRKTIIETDPNQCNGIMATCVLDPSRNIRIDFSYYDLKDQSYNTRISKTFIGRKIK